MTRSADTAPLVDDRRARRNVVLLALAQAVAGAQMPAIFTIGGLAGQWLSPNPCLATLPISLIVFGSMTTAPWLSQVMQRRGRRTGFVIGALAGALGAALGATGLATASFPLFLLGAYLTGIYMSAQGFFRFAAADTASESFRPKAISWVMAGGLGAAVLGSEIVKLTKDISPIPFLGLYMAVIALNLVGILLFLMLDIPRPRRRAKGERRGGRSLRDILHDPRVVVAMIVAAVSYALMNLVMTSTPLAVVGCGFDQGDAANVVMSHVLAMYIPSFFTGHLIARFGTIRIMTLGLVLIALAGGVALSGVDLGNFFLALVLIGLGWNFGFIGATTLLASAHAPEERGVVQGLNDMVVFGAVTFASLASGGLMNCAGGSVVEGWNMVNLAMIPFLVLAGGALIWLVMHPRFSQD